MNLWERDNYTAQISVLYNVYIYEYDISKANINILHSKGIIDKQTYDYLYNAERMKRQIYIGNLQKDPKIAQALKEGFIEYRHKLFMSNNIQDYEVLSIKKDAIYVISRRLQNTSFGLVNFIEKNWYSGFYKIKNLELYYRYNRINNDETLDVKGINDNILVLHNNHFMSFLKDLFCTLQCNGVSTALALLKDFYMSYITRSLSIEYYREFNNTSEYRILGTQYSRYTIILNNPINLNILDISYNLSIIIELQKILLSIYFSKG